MTEILDSIFSSFILMLVVSLVLLIVFIILGSKNPFKNNLINKTYKLLMYVCAGSFFFVASFLNFGHAREFEKMVVGKTMICVYEHHIRGGARSNGKPSRISILDKETGKRKGRFNAGKPGVFVDMRNDTICYMDENDVVLYDAANLKEIYRITENSWVNISPELSVGVEDIDVTNEDSDYDVTHYIVLNCLNGKKYWFEPFSKILVSKEPPLLNYLPTFANRSSELVIKYTPRKELKYLYTSTFRSNHLDAILPGPDGKKLFSKVDSTTYLEPFLLCIDTLKKVFVFGHYLTTKKEDYYLEAKDFNYTTLWKKQCSKLVDSDYNALNVWVYKNNILYFNIGGHVYAIDPTNFKIHWTVRL